MLKLLPHVSNGKINVIPGYDGEYGKAVIEGKKEEQKKLF